MITPAQLSSSAEVTINPDQPLTPATHHTRSTLSITPPSASNAVACPTVIQSSSAQNIIPQSASNAVTSPTVNRSPTAQNNIPLWQTKDTKLKYVEKQNLYPMVASKGLALKNSGNCW